MTQSVDHRQHADARDESCGKRIHAGQGEGAGFGVMARPVGAFVIKDGDVRWKPAIDLLPLAGIALLLLLVLRSIIKLKNQP